MTTKQEEIRDSTLSFFHQTTEHVTTILCSVELIDEDKQVRRFVTTDRKNVRLYNLREEIRRVPLPKDQEIEPLHIGHIPSQRALVIVHRKGSVTFYTDKLKERRTRKLCEENIVCCAVSRIRSEIALGLEDKSLKIFRIGRFGAEGKCANNPVNASLQWIDSCKESLRVLETGHKDETLIGSSLRYVFVWNTSTKDLTFCKETRYGSPITSLKFENILVTGHQDGSVAMWRCDRGESRLELMKCQSGCHSRAVSHVELANDNNSVFTCDGTGRVVHFNMSQDAIAEIGRYQSPPSKTRSSYGRIVSNILNCSKGFHDPQILVISGSTAVLLRVQVSQRRIENAISSKFVALRYVEQQELVTIGTSTITRVEEHHIVDISSSSNVSCATYVSSLNALMCGREDGTIEIRRNNGKIEFLDENMEIERDTVTTILVTPSHFRINKWGDEVERDRSKPLPFLVIVGTNQGDILRWILRTNNNTRKAKALKPVRGAHSKAVLCAHILRVEKDEIIWTIGREGIVRGFRSINFDVAAVFSAQAEITCSLVLNSQIVLGTTQGHIDIWQLSKTKCKRLRTSSSHLRSVTSLYNGNCGRMYVVVIFLVSLSLSLFVYVCMCVCVCVCVFFP